MPWSQVPGQVLEDSPLPSPPAGPPQPGPDAGGPGAYSPLPSGRHCGSEALSCFFTCLAFTWEPAGGAAAAGPALHSGPRGRAGWRAPARGGGLPTPRGPLALQGSGVHISEKEVPPPCLLHEHGATCPERTPAAPRLASVIRWDRCSQSRWGEGVVGTGVPPLRGSMARTALPTAYLGWRCVWGTGLLAGQPEAPPGPSSWWGVWAAVLGPWGRPGASSLSGAG